MSSRVGEQLPEGLSRTHSRSLVCPAVLASVRRGKEQVECLVCSPCAQHHAAAGFDPLMKTRDCVQLREPREDPHLVSDQSQPGISQPPFKCGTSSTFLLNFSMLLHTLFSLSPPGPWQIKPVASNTGSRKEFKQKSTIFLCRKIIQT